MNHRQKAFVEKWFASLQHTICQALLKLENTGTPASARYSFKNKTWKRPGGGGGTMAVLEGKLFQKAGVNISTVHGVLDPVFRKKIPGTEEDPRFWASGLSLVVHPRSPHIPIIHMNTRFIQTKKLWAGGGIDLTPVFPTYEDTKAFHQGLQGVCNRFDPDYYPKFKKWADRYFYIEHRKEPRGIGGIFYDNLEGDFEQLFAFTHAVGESFVPLYKPLVEKYAEKPWTAEDEHQQMIKRARYVEFNLIYDRGTTFGLKTNGFIDAIFMSLPPLAGWPAPDLGQAQVETA